LRLQVTARAVAAFVLLGVVVHADTRESHQFRRLVGTSIEVQAFGGSEPTRRAAIDEAFAAFTEVDRLMSNYRDDSELSAVNREAAQHALAVTNPLFAILDAAQRVSAASNGAFDVTVGPLMRLWRFHGKTPHVPGAAELAAVRPLVGYRNVHLDAERHTVQFTHPRLDLDLGARQYGDILDPRTLQPASASLSVTILSRDGTLADAMSKAAFVLGPKAGLALVDSFPGMAAVIAYRRPDGSVGIAMSATLAASWHPTP
jgi:thiamine biosynthesis lipoprotein ApbE